MDMKPTPLTRLPVWLFILFDLALCAALTLTLWSLIYDGASYLIYLSNWMITFNIMFYIAVAGSEQLFGLDIVSLLAAPMLLSSDILWVIHTLGLVLFGADCFKNTEGSTLAYIIYGVSAAYNHISPLIYLLLFVFYRFRDVVCIWVGMINFVLGREDQKTDAHARVCAFFGVFVWLAVPSLPCLVYSCIINPLSVYGLSMTQSQLNGIIMFSVCAHSVTAMIFLYYILHYRNRGHYLFDSHDS
jgi:hypothetical protein